MLSQILLMVCLACRKPQVHVDARLQQWIQGLLNESNICNVYNEKIYIMIYAFGKINARDCWYVCRNIDNACQ